MIKPLVTNGLSHCYHMDESIFIFRGSRIDIFIFISFFDEIHVSKQNSPRWDAPGLFCLPMSHKKDAKLIWVKYTAILWQISDVFFSYYFCSNQRVWV